MDPQTHHSCSTFQLSTSDAQLVGHNLDDYIEVPGLVVANPRGIVKENIGWQDLTGPRSRSCPRIQWTSKYGSITYNTFGKEFPDGGLNEAGLYIGEMTLFGTAYRWHQVCRKFTTTNGCNISWIIARRWIRCSPACHK